MNNEIRDMTDGERVVHTANLQDTSELQVFQRAHVGWFGREADAGELEQDFVHYLYFGATPHWVRHYTRTILGERIRTTPASTQRFGIASLLARLTETRLARFLTQ